MQEIIASTLNYFTFPFVRYALICGVLLSLCSALLGTSLVLKRFSFIGDGLSHVAFGALAVATVLRVFSDLVIVLPVTILCAVLLLRLGRSVRIKGDAAIAIISVTALAAGYLLLNLFPVSSNISGDVCSSLFGSTRIISLELKDVVLSAGIALITAVFFILFYNRIFAVTFDENFASSAGVRAGAVNLATSMIIAVVIVLAMNLVGSLLISALVVFPSLSAMRVYKTFKSVTICAIILATASFLTGFVASIMLNTPVGATVVIIQALAFAVFWIVGKAKRA
ncbi:MAG: metal ABC transporter permease [Clostridia bacterium]|nr:metal ABC transporter permease [Clostridia bacterium]